MLSKRFYNILTIVYLVLIITLVFIYFYFTYKAMVDRFEDFTGIEDAMNKMEERPLSLSLIAILMSILPSIYYIFILILAIQLHARKHLSMLNTVVIAIIIPLAPFFYIFTLKKALKECENKERNINNIQQSPTPY